MTITRIVAATSAGILMAAGMLAVAPASTAAVQSSSPTAAPAHVTSGPAFTARTVTVRKPAKVIYIVATEKTVVGKSSGVVKVKARGNGKYVEVKVGKNWVKVPYRYVPTSGSLVYEEALRARFGLLSSPLGLPTVKYVGCAPTTPTAGREGKTESWSPIYDPGCGPSQVPDGDADTPGVIIWDGCGPAPVPAEGQRVELARNPTCGPAPVPSS